MLSPTWLLKVNQPVLDKFCTVSTFIPSTKSYIYKIYNRDIVCVQFSITKDIFCLQFFICLSELCDVYLSHFACQCHVGESPLEPLVDEMRVGETYSFSTLPPTHTNVTLLHRNHFWLETQSWIWVKCAPLPWVGKIEHFSYKICDPI